jgi:CCR4-NOT transcription complex subunit 1
MIHNLFDEYRFFHKYPDKEVSEGWSEATAKALYHLPTYLTTLHSSLRSSSHPSSQLRITGILFGTLIQHQLVSSITLGIALRYVLEALRKQPVHGGSGKMFR